MEEQRGVVAVSMGKTSDDSVAKPAAVSSGLCLFQMHLDSVGEQTSFDPHMSLKDIQFLQVLQKSHCGGNMVVVTQGFLKGSKR